MIITLQIMLTYKRIKTIMVFYPKSPKGNKQLNIHHALRNDLGYTWHLHSNLNIGTSNNHGISSFSIYTCEDVSV